MIGRRLLIYSTAAACVWSRLSARAQQADKIARVGLLRLTPPVSSSRYWNAFHDELRHLGYAAGKNLIIDEASADNKVERLPELARALVARPVHVIFAAGGNAAQAARAATRSIPIVVIAGDTVGTGLVKNFSRPGGNITGIDIVGVETVAKQMGLLKALLPRLSRLATLDHAEHVLKGRLVMVARETAGKLSVALEHAELRGTGELDSIFSGFSDRKVEAVVVSPFTSFAADAARIAELGLRHRIAVTSYYKSGAEAGALLSYEPDLEVLMRRAARYVDKILRGAAPGDLPIEQPTHYKLAINLKTAKALGITVPPTILAVADEVIE